jgi:hypothetical protein
MIHVQEDIYLPTGLTAEEVMKVFPGYNRERYGIALQDVAAPTVNNSLPSSASKSRVNRKGVTAIIGRPKGSKDSVPRKRKGSDLAVLEGQPEGKRQKKPKTAEKKAKKEKKKGST